MAKLEPIVKSFTIMNERLAYSIASEITKEVNYDYWVETFGLLESIDYTEDIQAAEGLAFELMSIVFRLTKDASCD